MKYEKLNRLKQMIQSYNTTKGPIQDQQPKQEPAPVGPPQHQCLPDAKPATVMNQAPPIFAVSQGSRPHQMDMA